MEPKLTVSNKIQVYVDIVIMVTPLLNIDGDTQAWLQVLICYYDNLKSAVARFAGNNMLVAL